MMKLDQLEKRYNDVINKKEQLENEIELCRQRISRSSKLTNGLKSENERWRECILKLEDEAKYVIGEVFIASAVISYFGVFSGQYRKRVYDALKKELKDSGISLYFDPRGIEEIIGDPIEIQNWRICGLPSDTISISNAVIVTSSSKVPLMIDPQL